MVLDLGKGWDSEWVSNPSVVYNGFTFMMWYTGMDDNYVGSIGLATSVDGASWSRYSNNPVLKGAQDPCVIYEDGIYKMWYSGDANVGSSIGYATSQDGITWTRFTGNPVLSPGSFGSWDVGSLDQPSVVHQGSTYLMYYDASKSGSSGIGMATSKDGMHWTKTGQLPNGALGGWATLYEIGDVTSVNGSYVAVYWGGNHTLTQSIGIASSSDGVKWTPFEGNPILTPGPSSSWDGIAVLTPTLVHVRDQYYLYFSGWSYSQDLIITKIGMTILPATIPVPIPEFSSNITLTIAMTFAIIASLSIRKRFRI